MERSCIHILAGESIPCEPLADDLRASKLEAVKVVHVLALVVAKSLFVKIAEQVKGFHAHIGAADTALQE